MSLLKRKHVVGEIDRERKNKSITSRERKKKLVLKKVKGTHKAKRKSTKRFERLGNCVGLLQTESLKIR